MELEEFEESIAPDSYAAYESSLQGEFDLMFTGVSVYKRSRIGTVLGTRDRGRKKRGRPSNGNTPLFERKDLAAFAVRQANNLIATDTVKIRDGRKELPEYSLSASMVDANTELKRRGWARRLPRGS